MRNARPKHRAQSSSSRKASAWARAVAVIAVASGVCGTSGTMMGCAVSESDVQRWEKTERGPYKLVAVITHDKYSWPLRIESAISLIRMPPRGGRRQGINYLVEKYKDEDGVERDGALSQLGEEPRKKIVEGMAPELIKMMQTPPPVKKPDGTIDPDTSIPYKDAVYAMLSHEPSLVSDPKIKSDFIAALTSWVQADFENRIDNSSQQYGVEQVMRFLGAPSVRALPGLFTDATAKTDKEAQLIADLGDADTKQKASENLVALAKKMNSPDWVAKQRAMIAEADKKSGVTVTPAQIDQQTTQYQDQQLTTVFQAMKRVGERPVIEYALGYAGDTKNSETRRASALAALESRVDKSKQADIDRIFAIAKDDATPDSVRDLAFARLGELPKEIIVPKLYTLFDSKKWKVRWVAASSVLKTMSTKEVPDFMHHLPTSAATKMGMSEPISYGSLIQKMDPKGGPAPKDVIAPFLSDRSLGAKLAALGFYYNGKAADAAKVQGLAGDPTPVPKCDKDDDCGWSCDVPKPGSQDTESKTITTVGEFVKYCVVPSLSK